MEEITFSYGAWSDPIEEQANAQGFTLGNKADKWQKVYDAMVMLHIHDILTDGQYTKAIERYQKKMTKDLEPINKEDTGEGTV